MKPAVDGSPTGLLWYSNTVVSYCGPPDVLGLQLPEILANRGGGEGFWELKSKNIWRATVRHHWPKGRENELWKRGLPLPMVLNGSRRAGEWENVLVCVHVYVGAFNEAHSCAILCLLNPTPTNGCSQNSSLEINEFCIPLFCWRRGLLFVYVFWLGLQSSLSLSLSLPLKRKF